MKKRGGLVVITESPRVVPPPVTSLFFFVGLVLFRVSSVLSFWVGSDSDLHRLLIQRSFTHHCPPPPRPPPVSPCPSDACTVGVQDAPPGTADETLHQLSFSEASPALLSIYGLFDWDRYSVCRQTENP